VRLTSPPPPQSDPALQPAPGPQQGPRVPIWVVSLVLWLTFIAVLVARHAGLDEVPAFSTFGIIFSSIVIEALPFILIGALVSALMAVYVPDRVFARLGRLPTGMQIPGAALAGVAFPVCECGSVPVARRLIERGIAPSAGIAFMLAAPILNPVVLVSTWVAYGGGKLGAQMVAGRAGLGLLIAMAAGWALGRRDGGVLRARPAEAHFHSPTGARRGQRYLDHVVEDFVFMGRFLVLGAALSALLQTILPQDVISGLAGTPLLGTLALMGLAFLLSLCSEADAFVATSFTAFPLGSQLAFLVLGPMADTKLSVLYGAAFRPRFTPQLMLLVVPLCLLGSTLFGVVVT
jgi:uncharacterized protein